MSTPSVCFVAMPFDGELQYLFLYLEVYLQLSREPAEKAPFDIRGEEIISYRPEHDSQLRNDLGSAIEAVLSASELYEEACELLDQLCVFSNRTYRRVGQARFRLAIAAKKVPERGAKRIRELTTRVVDDDELGSEFMIRLDAWIDQRQP